jgi:hypothetical protein
MAIQDKKNEQHYINNYNVSILGAIANWNNMHIFIVKSI